MSDDLLKELDTVLKFEKNHETVHSSKLQTYFSNYDNDNDDLFATIIKENTNPDNFFESKSTDQKRITVSTDLNNHDEIKKSVRFSDTFDGDIDNVCKNFNNNMNTEAYVGAAWLTNENTKVILSKIMCKEISISQVNKSSLAKPQLHTDQNSRLQDPIYTLLADNYNISTATELRQIPSIENCQETKEEIIALLRNGWIRPAIDLTSKMLYKMGFTYAKSQLIDSTSSSFTLESGQIWCLRFALLVRIKLFSVLESELSGFQNLDCPNLYSEFYDDNVKYYKGSLIPFSMRLIYAELPCYFSRYSESLNRTYYLLAIIRRILLNLETGYSEFGTTFITAENLKKDTIELWHRREIRVLLSVLKILIASKDYPSAIDIVHEILNKSAKSYNVPLNELLYKLLARIYLHLGDLDNASFYFNESLRVFVEDETLQLRDKDKIVSSKLSLQSGYINMSRGNFEESKKCFQEYLEFDPSNTTVLNNYAVSCLYLKKVQEAISVFEKLIDNGIHHDALIFNLCILYELQTTQVKNRKLKVVKLLSKSMGDDFNISSFKLTNYD